MAESTPGAVDRECRTFTRYLCGIEPSAAVLRQYARGLDSAAFREGAAATALDGALEALARRGVLAAALADTYARFLAPAGRLRRRLVLLLAILESGRDAHRFEPPAAGPVRTFLALGMLAARFALLLPASLVVAGPLHIGTLLRRRAPT